MNWVQQGNDNEWRLYTRKGDWVGYVDPKHSCRKAAVWVNSWRAVPLPPEWSIEDAKATVLAVVALEA